MRTGKVEYPGHYLNGKTVEVAARGDYLGVALVFVREADGTRIGLPAERVRVFEMREEGAAE